MARFIEFILKQHKLVVILSLTACIGMGMFIPKMDLNNEPDIYFEKNDPLRIAYHQFRETFGNEEQAAIIFRDENMFSNQKIKLVRDISQMAKKLPFVHRVFSITEQDEAVTEGNSLSFRKVIPEGFLSNLELEKAKIKAIHNNILVNRFISNDGKTVAIVVEFDKIKNSEDKINLLQDLKKNALAIAQGNADLHFTGLPFVETEQNKLMIKDFIIITPLMILIIIIMVQVSLRSATMNIFSQLTINMMAIMTVGFYILAGESINIVTSIMTPVLLAISIADVIHYLSHYRDHRIFHGKNHYEAVRDAVKAIWLPCLFTSATTAVGFLSFLTATIRPVRILGIFTAFGVMLAYLLTITFLPALFILFARVFENMKTLKQAEVTEWERKDKKDYLLAFAGGNGRLAITYPMSIIFIFLILFAFAVYGLTKTTFETNVTEFFAEDSDVIRDINFIEENIGGFVNGELVVTAQSEQFDFSHPESLDILKKIQAHVTADEDYSSTLSVTDYLMEIHRAFNDNNDMFYKIPDTRETIMDYYELGDADDIDRLVSPDKMQARISYQMHNTTAENGKKNLEMFDKYITNLLQGNYTHNFTGSGLLWLNMDDNLKGSFIKSLLFAFLLIFGMMIFICKDLKLALISMIPNLFPIILTVGIMGWFHIPFNTITVMIACVTLGIAVDDTVHFIVWFRRNSLSGLTTRDALMVSYKNVGKPIIVTSIVLSLGFFILFFGSYKPMGTFGSLTALTIVFALFSDLLILPAILVVSSAIETNVIKQVGYYRKKIKVLLQGN